MTLVVFVSFMDFEAVRVGVEVTELVCENDGLRVNVFVFEEERSSVHDTVVLGVTLREYEKLGDGVSLSVFVVVVDWLAVRVIVGEKDILAVSVADAVDVGDGCERVGPVMVSVAEEDCESDSVTVVDGLPVPLGDLVRDIVLLTVSEGSFVALDESVCDGVAESSLVALCVGDLLVVLLGDALGLIETLGELVGESVLVSLGVSSLVKVIVAEAEFVALTVGLTVADGEADIE